MAMEYKEFEVVKAVDEDGKFVEYIIKDRITHVVIDYAADRKEAQMIIEEYVEGMHQYNNEGC